jgi:hypothetical protein
MLPGHPRSPVVDVAAVPERDDDYEEDFVVDGVDDAVVTDANTKPGSAL